MSITSDGILLQHALHGFSLGIASASRLPVRRESVAKRPRRDRGPETVPTAYAMQIPPLSRCWSVNRKHKALRKDRDLQPPHRITPALGPCLFLVASLTQCVVVDAPGPKPRIDAVPKTLGVHRYYLTRIGPGYSQFTPCRRAALVVVNRVFLFGLIPA